MNECTNRLLLPSNRTFGHSLAAWLLGPLWGNLVFDLLEEMERIRREAEAIRVTVRV